MSDTAAWLETATLAARGAGRIQRERARARVVVEKKGAADIITAVDRECEDFIVDLIRRRHPGHGVLGEEGARSEADGEWLWIIDPLDGTKNYAHGYGKSCVSIALALRGEPLLGVVYYPRADELFVAQAGQGATLNGQPIAVSPILALDSAMVASALTYDGRGADRAQLERLARVLGAAEAVRSDGCAALDLCDVACGRLDAYFERGLKAWDLAAGGLIVREAGGTVTSFAGTAYSPFGREVCASNGRIHDDLIKLL
jgi:myo-inositol-1(or 4)-monophosphatase